MSADRWSICPKCKRQRDDAVSKYGKVSEKEYLALLTEQQQAKTFYDLREDWDIGVAVDGVFEVSYACSCSKCGFKFDYKHAQMVVNPKE